MRARRLLTALSTVAVVAFSVGGCSEASPSGEGAGSGPGASTDNGRDSGATGSGDAGSGSPDVSYPDSGGAASDAGVGRGDSGSDGSEDSSAGPAADCSDPSLVWRTANKTSYESYPAPGSEECIEYNGCAYEGMFSACGEKVEPIEWVQTHNIVSVFPNLTKASNGIPALSFHDLCLKSGSKTIVVTAIDECADSDCSGCCTQNKGSADQLIDIESFTDAHWGVDDGPIQWADLGPTKGSGCN